MLIADTLMRRVRETRPDLYEAILRHIRPYSLRSVLKILDGHLRNAVPDLQVLNDHADRVPEFVWTLVKHMKFPTPGDAFGIFVISRLTKSDTQGALDSKHAISAANATTTSTAFHVEKDVLDELALFSSHQQLFELANRHQYATVFMSHDTSIAYLQSRLPEAGVLERGLGYNKARNAQGRDRYLVSFQYLLVEDRGSVKVLYKSLNDLSELLRRVPLQSVSAFSDVRCVFRKCGVLCAFFNLVRVAERQLFANVGSQYEKDVVTVLTYMCCRGVPLPMNREGLAKNRDKPPIDVISFEAMKRNCARIATSSGSTWHPVQTSLERIFYGQQFNEGTGYTFALRNKE